MAFDNSVPSAAAFPALHDMFDDDDEDNIVRKVKMLSMITAREEQERRERLNKELNLAQKPSDPNFRSSLTLQESSSLPELVGSVGIESSSRVVDGSGAKAAIYSQIARPRPHSGRSTQATESGVSTIPRSGTSAGAPSGAVVPPPLPAVRPNAKSRMQADPVRIPSPPRTAQRNRQEVPARPRDASANRSQSLSPPFHRSSLQASNSILCDLPAQSTVPSLSHDTPLICLSPPTSLKPDRVDDFDLTSLDPFQPHATAPLPTSHKSHLVKTVSDPVPQQPMRHSVDPKVLPYRNSPVPYPLDGTHFPTPPFVGGNDAMNGYPFALGFMPWTPNDLCSPTNPAHPMSWMTDSPGNIPATSTAEVASRNQPPASGSSSTGSDLMDFSADRSSPQLDPVYMDLADFDPLYTVDSKVWKSEQRFDSDTLFLKPGGNPVPHSAVVSATQPAVVNRPMAPLPDVVVQSSVARRISVDELQDPFSVQDLMVSLEKKRQKHAREQEIQEVVRGQEAQPEHGDSSSTATLSKRKVLLYDVHSLHRQKFIIIIIVI